MSWAVLEPGAAHMSSTLWWGLTSRSRGGIMLTASWRLMLPCSVKFKGMHLTFCWSTYWEHCLLQMMFEVWRRAVYTVRNVETTTALFRANTSYMVVPSSLLVIIAYCIVLLTWITCYNFKLHVTKVNSKVDIHSGNACTRLVPCLYPIKDKDRLLAYHSRDFIGYVVLKIWRHASRLVC